MKPLKEEKEESCKCRSGEYEGLSKKLIDPNGSSDFGPEFNKFVEKSGATQFLHAIS